MKKWLIIGLGLVAVIAAGIWYYTTFDEAESQDSPYRSMPAQVGICAEFENLAMLSASLDESAYGFLIKSTDVWFELERDVQLLDTLFIKGLGQKGTGRVICGWFPRNDEIIPLYILKLEMGEKEFSDALMNQNHPDYTIEKSMLINREMIDISRSDQNLTFHAITSGSNLILSRDVKLLELSQNAMEQTGSLNEVAGFQQVMEKTKGKGDFRLYLHYANLPGLLENTFNNSFSGILAHWGNLASVSAFGIVLESDIMGFNGFTYTGDSGLSHLSNLTASEPSVVDMPRLLPNETVMFSAYGQSAPIDFFDRINRSPGSDFKGFFQSWTGDEWAYFRWDDGVQQRDGLVVELDGMPNDALEDLKGLKNLLGIEHIETFDSLTGITYSQIYSPEVLPAVYPSQLYDLGSPFYAIINNYLVFGETLGVLREMQLSQRLNQTLGKHPNYQAVTTHMASTANSFTYLQLAGMSKELGDWIKMPMNANVEAELDKWQSFTPVTMQFSRLGDLIFSNGQVHFNPEGFLTDFAPVPGRTDSLLLAVADSLKDTIHTIDQLPDEYFRVSPVKTHATEAGYLFGEDHNHMIYLISVNGDTLKKRQIDGQIMGPIETVDFYLNGKIQYLFNTTNKLYLVDRNFEDVASYPITLSTKASNGVKMVYYPDAKKHRFFIGGTDGNVYGYTKEGSELPGWFPKSGIGVVKLQMLHIVAGGKDYLVVVNQNGVVHAFARDGSKRFEPVETGGNFSRPFSVSVTSAGFSIANVSGGKTVTINQDGKLTIN